MQVQGRNVAVTGGASGIGAALVRRMAAAGARTVAVVDVDGDGARAVADEVDGCAVVADLSSGDGVAAAVTAAETEMGPIDVWCSNAGVGLGGDLTADDEVWDTSWRVNVMAGVRAARLLVPGWVERGGGAFVTTVSAAGLLNHVLAAPYAATKAAALSFAENLAMTHGDLGVEVVAVCPQGVRTPMLERDPSGFLLQEAITPEEVADATVEGLEHGSFLVLPHPQVQDYALARAGDHDRWLAGMRRFRGKVVAHMDGDPADWG